MTPGHARTAAALALDVRHDRITAGVFDTTGDRLGEATTTTPARSPDALRRGAADALRQAVAAAQQQRTDAPPVQWLGLAVTASAGLLASDALPAPADIAHDAGLARGIAAGRALAHADAAFLAAGIAEPSTMLIDLRHMSLRMNSRVRADEPAAHEDSSPVTPEPDAILPGYIAYRSELHAGAARGWQSSASDRPEAAEPAPDLATIHAIALACRRRITALRDVGVPVRRFIVVGQAVADDPAVAQRLADVLAERVTIHRAPGPPVLGAAIAAALAAGPEAAGFPSRSALMHAISRRRALAAGRDPQIVRPDRAAAKKFAPDP